MTDTNAEGRVRTAPQSAAAATLTEATDQAKEVTHHAGDEVANVLDATKEQARGVVHGARARVAEEADGVTTRAADALSGTARDLADLASGQGSPDTQVAQFARQAGERVDRVASQLRERGYQGVADDVSRWARAHPGAFLAAAAGAGFLIGRVFRAADTQGVVDAAKGTTQDQDLRSRQAPQLDAGDPSLFAEERRTELVGTPAGMAPTDGAPIDLTDVQPGPVAGV